MSGLIVNKDKTQIIWRGKKQQAHDTYNVNVDLKWNVTEFKQLGIHFSSDLQKICELNFEPLIEKVTNLINCWKRRHLTPLGKTRGSLAKKKIMFLHSKNKASRKGYKGEC